MSAPHTLTIPIGPETPKLRNVHRTIRPELTAPGHHASNFEAETLDALQGFFLSPSDVRFLHSCMIRGTRPDDTAPDGRVVILRDDQWTRWRDLMRYCGVLQRHQAEFGMSRRSLQITPRAENPAASTSSTSR